ncbi:T9SS type A sorting domain-containing protein [Ferruginibacter paludis]|uniref:T9SS type A sorting domain-containing protein n=1 Tax=Ferruginibacter paludis TaxID=1310417 RepID=UPI0025B5A5A2|nr:T9SS type A sorting domain-containing protein [Ferruginibacter paludis]MDN3657888.1 T9SS type A sorting domain-containing protein [Ferruginibacter paludis]
MKPGICNYLIAMGAYCIYAGFFTIVFGQSVLFDFDNAPLHSGFPISQTANGITARLAGTGQGYSIQDANVLGFTPQGFSGRVIYPNSVFLSDLLVRFDTKLTDFSIMYSCQELGCDDAATMRVTAYMNGSLVGTNTKTAGNPGTWPVDTLRCSFQQGFDSVVVHYDSRPPTCQDYGVIFMADNMRVTPLGVVPVNLVYFTCTTDGNVAVLQWKSADEINLNSYLVQYAGDAAHFRDLGNVSSEGANHTYRFMHPGVNGTAYYRLKMIYKDGTNNYSDTRKLSFKTKTGLTILPNPSGDFVQIYCDRPTDVNTIQIVSVDGVIVKIVSPYIDRQKIDISNLSKGIYNVKLLSLNGKAMFEKLFLKME